MTKIIKSHWKWLVLGLIILLNFFLIANYRRENIDEPWVLSFYYNFLKHGITTDSVFLGNEGQVGIQHFGKTSAYIYGTILNLVGWTRHNVGYISFTLVLGAVFLWYKNALLLFKSKRFAYFFCVLLLTIEAYVAIINSSRNEAILLLISALGFFAYLKKQYFLAFLVLGIGLEIHPAALLGILPVAAHFIAYRPKISIKQALSVLLSGILCFTYYYLLHADVITQVPQVLLSGSQSGWSSLFWQYFIQANYYRHLFDLALFAGAFAVFLQKLFDKTALTRFLLIYSMLSLLTLLFFPRPNITYAATALTGIVLLTAYTLSQMKFGSYILLLVVLVTSAQYFWLIRQNSMYDLDAHINEISSLVPTDNVPVLSSTNEWYAFKDRTFYPAASLDRFPADLNDFYLLAEADFRDTSGQIVHPKLDRLLTRCSGSIINKTTVGQELYEISKYSCP